MRDEGMRLRITDAAIAPKGHNVEVLAVLVVLKLGIPTVLISQ
jgi:hypothetical protein